MTVGQGPAQPSPESRPTAPAFRGDTMFESTRDRIGAATGAAFIALIIVGNGMNTAGTTQSGHASGQQVLKDAAHTHSGTAATAGFVLEVLGFVAFMTFLGYLAD